jgi:hypothetical protein
MLLEQLVAEPQELRLRTFPNSTIAEQAGGQPACLCIVSAGRECALLPLTGECLS